MDKYCHTTLYNGCDYLASITSEAWTNMVNTGVQYIFIKHLSVILLSNMLTSLLLISQSIDKSTLQITDSNDNDTYDRWVCV